MPSDFEDLKRIFSWVEGITVDDDGLWKQKERIILPLHFESIVFYFKNGNLTFIENILNQEKN